MIFIDAPAGAGYSYSTSLPPPFPTLYNNLCSFLSTAAEGNMTINTVQYAEDVYSFFQLFFTEFPQYQPLDFHLFGESYAGHYIPALAARIVEGNKEPTSVQVNLKSIAPGNALVDPLGQYPFYPQMACNNSYGIMLVEQEMCDFMQSRLPLCLERIEKCYDEEAWAPCVWSGISCNYQQLIPAKFNRKDLNLYDVRLPKKKTAIKNVNLVDRSASPAKPATSATTFRPWRIGSAPPRFSFNSSARLATTGAAATTASTSFTNSLVPTGTVLLFRETAYMIFFFFLSLKKKRMRPYVREVQPLLDEAGIKVLVFSGDADYIGTKINAVAVTKL